jgi:pyruvate,water dikinase
MDAVDAAQPAPPVPAMPVVSLTQAATSPVELVGAEARTLGRLVVSGVAVPEGLVLTSGLLGDVLAASAIQVETATAEEVRTAAWPDAVERAIAEVAAHFGDAPLAVRSSAATEDGADASVAGQHASVLDVRGADALARAVRHCWATAFPARVGAYSTAAPEGADGTAAGFAVLVQRMVETDAAGVAFTADPLTGSPDEVVITAVPGVGAAVAPGRADADVWRVRDGVATPTAVRHMALTRQQAVAIADLARTVEQLLGGPQHVEWAMAEHRLVILQARPVTTLT